MGVDRLLARVAGTAHDILQLAPGILDARLHLLTVNGLEVGGGEVNLPLRAQGRTVEHLATITLRLDCPGGGLVTGGASARVRSSCGGPARPTTAWRPQATDG